MSKDSFNSSLIFCRFKLYCLLLLNIYIYTWISNTFDVHWQGRNRSEWMLTEIEWDDVTVDYTSLTWGVRRAQIICVNLSLRVVVFYTNTTALYWNFWWIWNICKQNMCSDGHNGKIRYFMIDQYNETSFTLLKWFS